MSGIVVRPIRRDDVDGFWHALDSVAREKNLLARDEAPPIDSTRAFIEKSVANGWVQFVAEADGAIIGWCDILARGDAPQTGVVGMGIVAPLRGMGIGEKLLRTALDAARAKDFTTIRLDVWTSNARAIRLYEKTGFVRLRTYSRPEDPDRFLHDMVWQEAPS